MRDDLLNDREIDFLLYEFLDVESLCERERYHEYSREGFDSILSLAKKIALSDFANHNAKGDQFEPQFDGEKVTLITETKTAWDSFSEAGFLAAHHLEIDGGLQLPEVVLRASLAYFNAANISSTAYPFLTIGAANLVAEFAEGELRSRFLPHMLSGRFSGTMALTEPGQGSALADIKTAARPAEDGTFRLFGNKMYISGGDHDLTENIIHMVLARIDGAPAGTKGISLFLCPKYLVDDEGRCRDRNDVALAGLLHKMGYRNSTSTALNFGEADGAIAYLVGEPNKGLYHMFQMMNEARIGVASGAAALAYEGYRYSLAYAKERRQGRLAECKDPTSKQVRIIEHADVQRMILIQKVYSEGSLALCLYASSLFEDGRTAATQELRNRAASLLDLIIPVVKSFPSKYGLEANYLAIQVLGGAGYIREYPVEQMYRDNRLNPIHEGTEGIQAIDLLGRKVRAGQGAAFDLFKSVIRESYISMADFSDLESMIKDHREALILLDEVTACLDNAYRIDADFALANASEYLDMFGRVLFAWIWLRQCEVALRGLRESGIPNTSKNYYCGKVQACKYYMEWELPTIKSQAERLLQQNATAYEMREEWF